MAPAHFSIDLLLQNLPGAVYRCKNDEHWTMEFLSPCIKELTGYKPAELVGNSRLSYGELIIPEDRRNLLNAVRDAVDGKRPFQVTYRIRDADGNLKWVWEQGRAVSNDDGEVVALEGYLTDISHLKQTEQELRQSEARLKQQASLLHKAKDAIIVRRLDDHRIMFWNDGAKSLYGWSEEEVLDRPISSLLYEDRAAFDAANECVIRQGEWFGQLTQRCKDTRTIIVEARWTLVNGEHGNPDCVFCINSDITDRKAAERRVYQLAYHDPLTGLPNRSFMLDRLRHVLDTSARTHDMAAVMFIDLDNFKYINDAFGHDRGDMLLEQVAARLLQCVRVSDTVARFGGDEFVILLENLDHNAQRAAAQTLHVAEKILAAFSAPFQLDSSQHSTSPSIGVTLFKGADSTMTEILKRADVAMYQAKASGRDTVRFFDPAMQEAITHRSALESDMRNGVLSGQFLLYYQPQVDPEGKIIGVEALMRWQRHQKLLMLPKEFIPMAEETGLIVQLGRWAMEEACRNLVLWVENDDTLNWTVSVNISAGQIHRRDFVDMVKEVLEQTSLDPFRLRLELTESVLLTDIDSAVAKMNRLRDLGISFSLDDFGTGYSSLSYLRRLPIDQLKIEQSFVQDALKNRKDAEIARSILQLGQNMGIEVIAEGVETEAQYDFFARHGCHGYQGFLFSHPTPPGDIVKSTRHMA